jgi:hypothetical protein
MQALGVAIGKLGKLARLRRQLACRVRGEQPQRSANGRDGRTKLVAHYSDKFVFRSLQVLTTGDVLYLRDEIQRLLLVIAHQ